MTNSDQITSQAKALMGQGKIQQAADLISTLLNDQTDHQEGLYILAVCQRYLNQHKAALKTLDQLLKLDPNYGRAYQEKGHIFKATSDMPKAVSAYEQAVSFNSALLASWQSLAEIYKQHQDHNNLSRVNTHIAALSKMAPELVSVSSMLAENKLYLAEHLCRAYMQKNPKDVEGMRLLAQIGLRLNILDDAEFLLESALEFAPENRLARFDFITVLHKRQKYQQALEQATKLYSEDPDNIAFIQAYANANLALGHYDLALDCYDHLIEKQPNVTSFYMMRGHAYKTTGQQDKAIMAYQKAYDIKQDNGDAYWSLANLKTYRFTDQELQQMTRMIDLDSTTLLDRYHLCFALGKAYEDRKEFENAFRFYEKGNALKNQETNYSADRIQKEMRLQKEICTPELMKQRRNDGCAAPDPIFILGLPRAGSTLLEQILASHSQVDGTLELPNILATAHRLDGRRRIDEEGRYPKILETLTAEQCRTLGQKYIDDTQVFRKGAPFFIDKMPNNFRHIGLIHMILPNAKIIDARRDPMSCCFSGFKQLFAEGQEFTYGQEQIGRYYKDYVNLMDHWDAVLPGKVLRVQYEDVVDDLETQVRRLLDFCDLPFEKACLEFYKTERDVRTASSEQVRQPINRKGIDQWRHFEPYLSDLKRALGPAYTE